MTSMTSLIPEEEHSHSDEILHSVVDAYLHKNEIIVC